jgi:hypothetical protein
MTPEHRERFRDQTADARNRALNQAPATISAASTAILSWLWSGGETSEGPGLATTQRQNGPGERGLR